MKEAHDNSAQETNEIGHSPCDLSRLPMEVRWMVLDCVPESIGMMMMACTSWKAMIEEWMIPQNLPPMLNVQMVEKDQQNITVAVKFLCCGVLFSMRALLDDPEINYTKEVDEEGCKEYYFEIPYGTAIIDRLSLALSATVTGVWVDEKIGESHAPTFLNAVKDLVKRMKRVFTFYYVRSELNDTCTDFVTAFSSNAHIKEFKCLILSSSLSDPQRFLLELSGRVGLVSIGYMKHKAGNAAFLNAKEANWVDLVPRMFGRGATEIQLTNYYGTAIAFNDIRQIVEILVLKGDPFIFRTSLQGAPPQLDIKDVKVMVKTIQSRTLMSFAFRRDFSGNRIYENNCMAEKNNRSLFI